MLVSGRSIELVHPRHVRSSERAISSTLGVVLLVAIAVMTMAVIGTVVLGGGFVERSPEADIVFQEEGDGSVTIALRDARGLNAGDTEIRLRGVGSCGTWDGSGELETGDRTTVDDADCSGPLDEGDVLQVVAAETLIGTYEIRG
jgi:flagellin-like protein